MAVRCDQCGEWIEPDHPNEPHQHRPTCTMYGRPAFDGTYPADDPAAPKVATFSRESSVSGGKDGSQ